MKKSFLYSILFLCATILFSCKKDGSNEPAPAETGTIQIKFEHVIDENDLELNTAYTSENNEAFSISTLKYYVSNVVLTRIDGSFYKVPESYYLVDASTAVSSIVPVSLMNIPVGKYKGISFLLGVDSMRNVSGAQTGDLDVGVEGKGKSMFWDWKTGYVFVKYEGAFSNASVTDKMFMYHLAGFKKAENSLKTVDLPFTSGAELIVNKAGTPQIHLQVDTYKLVTNFSTTTNFMGASSSFADNAASMFTFEHIHN